MAAADRRNVMTKKKVEAVTPPVDTADPGAAAVGLPGPADEVGEVEAVRVNEDGSAFVEPVGEVPAAEAGDAPEGVPPDDAPPAEDAPAVAPEPAPESAPEPAPEPEAVPVAAEVFAEPAAASARVQRANS
jgi:hypothetical protein